MGKFLGFIKAKSKAFMAGSQLRFPNSIHPVILPSPVILREVAVHKKTAPPNN